jgi:hypothetical protein
MIQMKDLFIGKLVKDSNDIIVSIHHLTINCSKEVIPVVAYPTTEAMASPFAIKAILASDEFRNSAFNINSKYVAVHNCNLYEIED